MYNYGRRLKLIFTKTLSKNLKDTTTNRYALYSKSNNKGHTLFPKNMLNIYINWHNRPQKGSQHIFKNWCHTYMSSDRSEI